MPSDEIIAFYGILLWILILEIPMRTYRDRESLLQLLVKHPNA